MGTTIEKFDEFQKASSYFLKGWNHAEIARELDIPIVKAKHLIKEYKEFIQQRAQDDPDFLDRLAENTLELLDEVDQLKREAWEVYELAKDNQVMSQMAPALKLAGEFTDKRAKLLQLMGARTDSGSTARMKRAEEVNRIVTYILRDVVSDCPKCKVEVQAQLAQAFSLMGEAENVTDPTLIDGEIVDDTEV